MLLPTPWRKIEMQSPVNEKWLDISDMVPGTVDFEETDSGLDEASFLISNAAVVWAAHMSEGIGVRLHVGYTGQNRSMQRLRFDGKVSDFSLQCGANGHLEIDVKVSTPFMDLQANTVGSVTYPGNKSNRDLHQREFHFKDKIKISEIVAGILGEYRLPVGQITIEPKRDYEFTQLNPIRQAEDETDLQFITRLLTGKTGRGLNFGKKKGQKLVNARARMFWEVDPLDNKAKAYVAPVSKLMQDRGTHTLIPTFSTSQEMDFSQMDLFSPFSHLPMESGWRLDSNPNRASGREVQFHQDVPPDAKGNRTVGSGATGDVNRGAQKRDVIQKDKKLSKQPDDFLKFWSNYRLDRKAIREATQRGDLKKGTELDIIQSLAAGDGRYTWETVKKYFRRRETKHVPSGRKVPGSAKLPKKPPKTPTRPAGTLGRGSGGQGAAGTANSSEDVYDQMPFKYGLSWELTTYGTPFFSARKIYPVKTTALANFAGDWYCDKASHSIGEVWKIKIHLSR